MAGLAAAGHSSNDAERVVSERLAWAFPAGVPTGGHAVFDVVDTDGGTVGYVWIGPDATDDSGAWQFWSVVIDDDKYGRGFGRAAMHLAEEYARAQGATSIGVQVFGDHTSSRVLYESLGYSAVSVKMRKILS